MQVHKRHTFAPYLVSLPDPQVRIPQPPMLSSVLIALEKERIFPSAESRPAVNLQIIKVDQKSRPRISSLRNKRILISSQFILTHNKQIHTVYYQDHKAKTAVTEELTFSHSHRTSQNLVSLSGQNPQKLCSRGRLCLGFAWPPLGLHGLSVVCLDQTCQWV